jgi:hypothetical protein
MRDSRTGSPVETGRGGFLRHWIGGPPEEIAVGPNASGESESGSVNVTINTKKYEFHIGEENGTGGCSHRGEGAGSYP